MPFLPRLRVSLLAALAVLVGGCAASVWAWQRAADQVQQRADLALDHFSGLAFAEIERAVSHQSDLLYSFQALFRAGHQVSRAQFQQLFDDLRVPARFPGIRVIQYAERASSAELPALVARVRADRSVDPQGYPGFTVHPPSAEADHMVVVYAAPMAGNEGTLGRDHMAVPSRRAVLEQARDTGQVSTSEPLELLQGRSGYVVRLPVYRSGVALDSVQARRDALVGQVSGVFTAESLLNPVVDTHSGSNYRLTVHDEGAVDAPPGAEAKPALLASAGELTIGDAAVPEADLRRHIISHGGRLWGLRVTRAPVNAAWQSTPLALLGCGVALSVALAALLAWMERTRQHASTLAQRWSSQARRTARRLDAVLDNTVDGVLTLDEHHRIVAANRRTVSIFGIEREAMVGRELRSLLAMTDGQVLDTVAWEAGQTRELDGVRADGTPFPLSLTLAQADVDGESHPVVTVRDLTDARTAEQAIAMTLNALQQATALQQTMLRHAAFAIVMTDAQGRVRAANPAAEALLGRSADALSELPDFGELLAPDDLQALAGRVDAAASGSAVLRAALGQRDHMELELHLLRADGASVPVSLTVTALPHDDSAATRSEGGLLCIAYNVTERRQLAANLSRLAYSDSLTGLANRTQLERELTQALVGARLRQHPLALLFLDLDRFKPINDLHGHAMGDKVLCEVAQRMRATLRTTDISARLGGDEFVALLPAISDPSDCVTVADKLIKAIGEPMTFDGVCVSVGVSIGVVTYPDGGDDAAALLQQADAAMYAVKQAGRNGYRLSVPSATE